MIYGIMGGPLIKICGLNTVEALDAALAAGADMVGFVFFPPSPRHLDLEAAHALCGRVAGRAKTVALSVDATDPDLAEITKAIEPDLLQLHGKETPERVAAVKARFQLPVMKALAIAERADLGSIQSYSNVADRLVFDGRPPKDATRPGGLGKPFDWHLLEGLDPGLRFMLSGGLDAGNVLEAVRITRAPAVDVSSGVERAPGDKDPEKIRAFIRMARQAGAGADKVMSNA
jgi:phosphoribosylanthranilate isomerase